MSILIRPIDPGETADWLASLRTSFLASWPVGPIADDVLTLWDYQRVWAAVESGAIVGTARSWATQLTIPGGVQLPGSAIAGVGVLPSHRRRGLLRRLIDADLVAARDRGEQVAVLWASQAAIYGRVGFGPATRTATWRIDVSGGSIGGTPRPDALAVMTPSTQARDLIRGVFETWRGRQVGEIRRRDFTWDDALGLRPSVRGDDPWIGTLVVHRGPEGEPDGYARYHLEERWEHRRGVGVLHVDELHALTDEAYRDLWRLIVGLEWVATVRAETRAPQERLPWLLADMRAAQPETIADGLWLRIIDLPAALAARRYHASGRLVLGVQQTNDGPAMERVLLEASPEGATCRVTDQLPDLVVDSGVLAAAYLGGASLADAALARAADEHRPGALRTLDRLLGTTDQPWCSTFF